MPYRVLFVDDQEVILFALRDYFTVLGYEVDCANDLEKAQSMIEDNRYAVVMVDLRLTGSHATEGLELVRTIKSKSPGTRVIMLTAYGSPGIEAEATRAGVDLFVQKPKPLPEIAEIVEALLKSLGMCA